MVRNKIFSTSTSSAFRFRGHEILRIEAISDAVFAFSVSLLVAALEVPQTFSELMLIIRGALPFFATVALLFLLWYRQYLFFRYYGLNDLPTILLNLVYMAVILFYVYPLKFLFSLLLAKWSGINLFPKAVENGWVIIRQEDFPQLIAIFSTGYFFIWLLLFLMYHRAHRFAKKLELDHYELQVTLKEKRGALWNAGIGMVSAVLSLLNATRMAGLCFLLIPVLLWINEAIFKKRIRRGGSL